ncbi:MAG: methionyl-tRNA formyltransferase [Candidatus Omnitrophica bacterium]|nr:methionyl-tRNA formyltransferase [Candidatus Omnitrophota bacterium]
MRIVFFGCDDFAAVNLTHLIDRGHRVVGLVTQPDKPKGRGLHCGYSPTKQIAFAHGIAVFQPETLKDPVLVDKLRWFHADIFVVIAYGKFLPQEVLDLPKHFCINVHASLLPKYRGAAPINWAIIHGETETGVTIMKMDAGMDTGAIIAQCACPVPDEMTSAELRRDLAGMGADLLSDSLRRIKSGDFTVTPQDHALASRAPKMHKDLGHIHWQTTAKEIHDLVRGVQPWPGAFTFWRGNRLKVLEAQASEAQLKGKPGEIVELHKDGFYVQAGDRAVLVKRVLPANSHAMDARAFLAGHKLMIGEILG